MGDLKESSFGACEIASYSPEKKAITGDTKVLNVKIKFEEALKLNLAIDECVRKLNRYKMSSTAGQRAGVNLAIHFQADRIAIVEAKI
jgi:hypothetical protein